MKKGNWSKIRAFFDIKTEEGSTMKGFKLVEGVNGMFAGFPSQKGKDEEYHDTIWADRELKDSVTSLAVKEYEGDGIVEMELDNLPLSMKKEEPKEEKNELPF